MTELLALIDEQIAANAHPDDMASARRDRLEAIKKYLPKHGYPRALPERASLSLVPFIFQEANYDGIDWSIQNADLEHLTPLFEIDARVMNEGKPRKDLSETEFARYHEESFRIIDMHRAP